MEKISQVWGRRWKGFVHFSKHFVHYFQKTFDVIQETFCALLKKDFVYLRKHFAYFSKKDFVHFLEKDYLYFSKHFVYFSKHILHLSVTVESPKTKYYRDYRKFDIDYFSSELSRQLDSTFCSIKRMKTVKS